MPAIIAKPIYFSRFFLCPILGYEAGVVTELASLEKLYKSIASLIASSVPKINFKEICGGV